MNRKKYVREAHDVFTMRFAFYFCFICISKCQEVGMILIHMNE